MGYEDDQQKWAKKRQELYAQSADMVKDIEHKEDELERVDSQLDEKEQEIAKASTELKGVIDDIAEGSRLAKELAEGRSKVESELEGEVKEKAVQLVRLDNMIANLQTRIGELDPVVKDLSRYTQEHKDARAKHLEWKKGADAEKQSFESEKAQITKEKKDLEAAQEEVSAARKYVEEYHHRLGGHISDAKKVIIEVNALLAAGRLPAKYEMPPEIDWEIIKWKE